MLSDDDRAKLRFELANANLQSVSRAQGLYVTALLIYICFVWLTFLTRSGEGVTIHMEWLELKSDAIWKITPFITMVLTLAATGTINATMSAYTELREVSAELFGSRFEALFHVDTHKNVVDYLALLQILPWGKTRRPADSHGRQHLWLRFHHLIFPCLFLMSLATSYCAVRQASLSPNHGVFLAIGWTCFGFQTLFSVRPMWRWIGRVFGAERTNDVYK
jgi:hypothetical protein